ncbi:hypothetical protein [Spirosoma harenae]
MKTYFLLFLFLLNCTITVLAQQQIQETFDTKTVDQISTLKIEPTTPENYLKLTKFAIQIANNTDTANAQKALKAQVLLDILHIHLADQIKNKILDDDDQIVCLLDTLYLAQGYKIIDHSPSELAKLIHYIHEGKYAHIYSRLSNSWFFIPLIGSILIVTLFPSAI